MKQKVFKNGNDWDSRKILIQISEGYIEFFFEEQYNRKKSWILEETERRNECGEEPLTEDELSNSNFYWIMIDDWIIPERGFEDHMSRKSWFTNEMKNFLNKNLKTMKNFIDWYVQDFEECSSSEAELKCEQRIKHHIDKLKGDFDGQNIDSEDYTPKVMLELLEKYTEYLKQSV